MTTPREDRQRTIRMVEAKIGHGEFWEAADLLSPVALHRMGRTMRWRIAAGSLRVALHDVAAGAATVESLAPLVAAAHRDAR